MTPNVWFGVGSSGLVDWFVRRLNFWRKVQALAHLDLFPFSGFRYHAGNPHVNPAPPRHTQPCLALVPEKAYVTDCPGRNG